MTPQERAEKIDIELDYILTIEQKRCLAAEIEEAVREALKVRDHDVKIAVDNSFKMQAEAYEECAKIAEDEECAEYCCSDPVFKVSTKIRAKAKELSL